MHRTFSRTFFDSDAITDFFDQYLSLPSTKTKKTDTEYKLEMSVPGLNKNDLSIDAENGILTISNENQGQFTGVFKKQYNIPDDVDTEKISAGFKDGVLTVTLPISKTKKPTKTITIN